MVKEGKGGGGKRVSKSQKSGLQFGVGRIHTFLKSESMLSHHRISQGTAVYMAAALEYLNAEILELAGNAARDNKKSRIIPRHISLAIENDEELKKLFLHCIIPNGGVLPNIHMALIPKSTFSNPNKQPATGFINKAKAENSDEDEDEDNDGDFKDDPAPFVSQEY